MQETPRDGIDHQRRSQLLAVKLRALVNDHLGEQIDVQVESIPHGAALRHGDDAWILIDGPAARSLGAALIWTIRRDARVLHIVAEQDTGVLARRAAGFDMPINVWFAEGRMLLPAPPEPLPTPPAPQTEHLALQALITEAGADPNCEHGVVFGEVRGLEVCRVVDTPTTGFFDEFMDHRPDTLNDRDGVQLEVGVGAADREAFQLLHGDRPTVEALAGVVHSVATYRNPVSPHHPLKRLGAERLLRWQVVQQPDLVGCTAVVVAEPPVARPNLKDPTPCVAIGTTPDGAQQRIVFTTGVVLDAVPFCVDVQSMGDEPVLLALPQRDALPIIRRLADLLVTPIEIVEVEPSSPRQ